MKTKPTGSRKTSRLRCAVLGMAHDHLWSFVKHPPEAAQLVAGAEPGPGAARPFCQTDRLPAAL
jgi:hypothetical protein